MKIVGIVVEYNPFHNGHLHQIETLKSKYNPDGIIVVMSGHFVQRGEPALIDKWTRASFALQHGVDLVIELPTYFATSSAEGFARGAVKCLIDTGLVTHICFGSEIDDIDALIEISTILSNEPAEYKSALAANLAMGHTFPKARQIALSDYLQKTDGALDFIKSSNSILGIAYLKALEYYKSSIIPILIKREGAAYNETDIQSQSPLASATAIRHALLTSDDRKFLYKVTPTLVANVLSDIPKLQFHTLNHYSDLIKYRLMATDLDYLSTIKEVREGLENKLKNHLNQFETLDIYLDLLKSKRYTAGTLRRILINMLLDIHQMDVAPNYIRVLGFTNTGQILLKKMKKTTDVEIVTTLSKASSRVKNNPHLLLDILATDLYNLPLKGAFGLDFLTMPIQIK